MKMFFCALIGLALSVVVARAEGPVDTAKNVTKDAVDTAANVGHKVVRGTKRVVHKIADAVTPEPDARRIDVTVSEDKIDMPAKVKPGKTAFVVHNTGKETRGFAVESDAGAYEFEHDVRPGQTKVLHVSLSKGSYSVRSSAANKANEKGASTTLTVR
jgi:hypothetical protein